MKVGIASDHAGYALKQAIVAHFKQIIFTDFGTNSAESADYPDYAHPLANAIEQNEMPIGIAICGSGNGINMTMNKHQNIRAALCWNSELAGLARAHNNANVLSLPARFITTEEAFDIVTAFINTEFEGGRHERRVSKIACV